MISPPPLQVTVALKTSVSQTRTALELRSLPAQRKTAVWEQMMAYHMVLQETVVNALVSVVVCKIYRWLEPLYCFVLHHG